MDLKKYMESHREKLDICQYGFTTTEQLVISEEVRSLCEANSCGCYGTSWSCPPGVGTLEQCRAEIMKYTYVLVYTTRHELENSFDFEGMMAGKDRHEQISEQLTAELKPLIQGGYLLLSGGSCSRCETCTYPDAPCRFPDKMTPTVESYGIEVNRLAESAHVSYVNGPDTVTYFGCILYGRGRSDRTEPNQKIKSGKK